MIEGIRWVDKEVDEGWGRGWTIKRVLQAYDGHTWFDVPLIDIADTVEVPRGQKK